MVPRTIIWDTLLNTGIFFLKVIYKGMVYPGSWTGSTSIDDGFFNSNTYCEGIEFLVYNDAKWVQYILH
jgi:hypothetical protein